VVQSQVVLGVHRELHLLGAARRLGKVTDACGNGWDSAREPVALSPELEARLTQAAPYFCFVGRGGDAVKNTSLIEEAMAGERLRKHLVAVPGDGFGERATKIGVLDSGQVLSVLRGSQGLLLPSHYEGMPLVALEALGHGVPVYASRVGGLATLDDSLQGLTFLEAEDARPWREALEAALGSPEHGERPRVERARVNRMHLKTWAQVADSAVAAVQKARKK
jgi:glycosyltransferase involved in cell wall biosynthesis